MVRICPIWLTLLALLALPASMTAAPGRLKAPSVSPTQGPVGANVNVTVRMTGEKCAYVVDFGEVVNGPYAMNAGNKVRSHAYQGAGSFTVAVRGANKPGGPRACRGNPAPVAVTISNGSPLPPGGGSNVLRQVAPKPGVLVPIGSKKGKKVPGSPTGSTVPPGASDAGKPKLPELKIPTCEDHPCVNAVRVKAKGTSAEFEVLATKENAVKVEVGSHKPNGSQWSSHMPSPSGSAFSIQYRNPSITTVHSLEPGREYWYLVRTKDKEGREAFKTGKFSTAGRHARITLRRVFANDDGDDGASEGEFRFSFKEGGADKFSAHADISSGSGVTMGSAQCQPACSFTLDAAPETIQLSIGVFENDWTDYPTPGVQFTGESEYTWLEQDIFLGATDRKTWSHGKKIANGEFEVMVYYDIEVWYD